MRVQLGSIQPIFEGFMIKGTVNGHPVSIDLPAAYVSRLDREAGRSYMEQSLAKVFCAMHGIDYNGSH